MGYALVPAVEVAKRVAPRRAAENPSSSSLFGPSVREVSVRMRRSSPSLSEALAAE